jgi:lipid-A-disaccharide synthase-like uncharacterized protein
MVGQVIFTGRFMLQLGSPSRPTVRSTPSTSGTCR